MVPTDTHLQCQRCRGLSGDVPTGSVGGARDAWFTEGRKSADRAALAVMHRGMI